MQLGSTGLLPNDGELPKHIPWLHVPCDREMTGTITCSIHFGAWVHFVPGGSAFHIEDGCRYCESDQPPIFKFWLSLWQPELIQHGILELGQLQIPWLKSLYRESESLRGRNVELWHETPHRFSRIHCKAQGWHYPAEEVPEALDLPTIIRRRILDREDLAERPPGMRMVS